MSIRVSTKEYPLAVINRIVTQQMRLTEDDAELYKNALRLLRAAFDIAESYTNRVIVKSVIEIGLPSINNLMELNVMPVCSIDSVKYIDSENSTKILDTTSYNLVASENRTRIEFFKLPNITTTQRLEKVVLTVTAGYDDYDNLFDVGCQKERYRLPGAIEAAVQLIAGTLFESDGDIVIGRLVSELPQSAKVLLQPYRVLPYGTQI